VLAAEIAVDSPDFGHPEPMVNATVTELGRAGVAERPTVALADAGYWHHEQMDSLAAGGIQGADPARRRQAKARPAPLAGRPLRVDAQSARDRTRRAALSTTLTVVGSFLALIVMPSASGAISRTMSVTSAALTKSESRAWSRAVAGRAAPALRPRGCMMNVRFASDLGGRWFSGSNLSADGARGPLSGQRRTQVSGAKHVHLRSDPRDPRAGLVANPCG
jgi:hypothetical protein